MNKSWWKACPDWAGWVVGTGQYLLFHPKFYEYLRRHLFVEEEKIWHRKLADWCEGGRERDGIAAIWQESYDQVEQGRREYARRHYIAHLYEAREWLGYLGPGVEAGSGSLQC